MKKIRYGWALIFLLAANAFAENRVVNLVVEYKTVYFAGKSSKAISVNNQIPAPTLHFKQGDTVTLNVYNHLDQGTAIHWHGIILPWQMDGVEGISQSPIPPGGVFHYHFTLHQSGTYWYHAHADLQEQEGLYGAFIIDPPHAPAYHYNKDHVIILSDWSNTSANKILANLKKSGDYYSPKFPLQPSLIKFIHDYQQSSPEEREELIADYKMMQQMRMSIYDLSDVAYDAYLLNGQTRDQPWVTQVKLGDTVRLRFIGAAGSTIYHVKIANQKMQMIQVDGNNIKPYFVNDFTIAPGETYDLLVKITKKNPYIIYAESLDTRGLAIGALTTNPKQKIGYKNITPFPEPKPVTRDMMNNLMLQNPREHTMSAHMEMTMPTEPSIIGDTISAKNSYPAKTSGTQYQSLVAAVKTNDPNKPIAGIIRMELFGYMNHFIWFINGLPEYKAHPIIIQPNKRYRIIFTNNSMMRHPMHIHGHWFILRNGHGAYDPLLHTIEVAPAAVVVADWDTDASGQWFFHCHHLYHMMTGMSRVFQYSTIIDVIQHKMKPENIVKNSAYVNRPIVRIDEQVPINPALINHPMAHLPDFYWSTLIDAGEDPFNNIQQFTFKGLYGSDYNKLELFTNDAEINNGNVEDADLDLFYSHLISQFWWIKAGANYFYRPAQTPYWQPGVSIEGLMPYFIDTDLRIYYHSNSVKFDIELFRDTQISNNFFIRLALRSILATQTVTEDEIGSGLNQMRYIVRPYYRLMPGLDVFTEYEHQENYGAFKSISSNSGDPSSENSLTFGFSALI